MNLNPLLFKIKNKMAEFIVPSNRLTNPRVNQILSWIQNMLPQRIVRGIKTLLQPCCELQISNVSVDCSSGNVIVTLTNPVFYETPILFVLFVNGTPRDVEVNPNVYLNGIITFPGVGLGNNTILISVGLVIPTSTDGHTGVWQETNSFTYKVSC